MAVAVTVDVPGRTGQQCQQIAAKIVVPSQQESEDFARGQLLPG